MDKQIIGRFLKIDLVVIGIVVGCTSKKTKPTSVTNLSVTEVRASETPAQNINLLIPSSIPTITSINTILPTETQKPTQTFTPVPTETPTSSLTPSPTDTLTATFKPTSTETPSPTPSPTPNMVMPGFYATCDCATVGVAYKVQYTFCVTSVTVNRERHMLFSVSWTLASIPAGVTVSKRSDEGNRKK